ncbi:MAG: hypothetical protein AB7N76_03280 [Planctomycetota bacterium]
MRVRAAGSLDPALHERVLEEQVRRRRRGLLLDISLVWCALALMGIALGGGARWLVERLPAPLAPSEGWALAQLALGMGLAQLALRWRLALRPVARRAWRASGVAELCERGVWLEKPGVPGLALAWEDLAGYGERDDTLRLFAREEVWLEAVEGAAPEIDALLHLPTPSAADRDALLQELARRFDA